MEKHIDYQKYEIKILETIIWKVVWSWVGMRAFFKNALVPPTPILLHYLSHSEKKDEDFYGVKLIQIY